MLDLVQRSNSLLTRTKRCRCSSAGDLKQSNVNHWKEAPTIVQARAVSSAKGWAMDDSRLDYYQEYHEENSGRRGHFKWYSFV